jgi:hypothetical protein
MKTTALTIALETEILAATQEEELDAEFVERFAGDCKRFSEAVIRLRIPGTFGMFSATRKVLDEIEKFEQRQRREDAETLRVQVQPKALTLSTSAAEITGAD